MSFFIQKRNHPDKNSMHMLLFLFLHLLIIDSLYAKISIKSSSDKKLDLNTNFKVVNQIHKSNHIYSHSEEIKLRNEITQNFFKEVESQISVILQKDLSLLHGIDFEEFSRVFKSGPFGMIAPKIVNNQTFISKYFKYATKEDLMSYSEFRKFYRQYVFESELLIENIHPFLSKDFPNNFNYFGVKAHQKIKDYYDMIKNIVDNLFLKIYKIPIGFQIKFDKFKEIFLNSNLGKYYTEVLKLQITEEVLPIIKKYFDYYDFDRDNKIGKEEFLLYYAEFWVDEFITLREYYENKNVTKRKLS